ncbi:hypothetical protein BJX61DRAFT_173817 [Aspergillus egyptiacus]|nr:hypothetical protein BJX61DRAFT_173817 [Aspergillus egyptiacus]
MADFTPETRINRFKEWARAKSAPANAKLLQPGSNIILGAAIHGMARRSKGVTNLTEIENIGVKFFDIMAESEEELKTYGEICAEAKTISRSGGFVAANIPSSITTLSEETPYTRERFMADVKELAVATLQQPHIRAVTPEQIKPDGTIETTDAFAKASSELGRGVNIFTVSKDSSKGALNEDEIRGKMSGRIGPGGKIMIPMKIEPELFKCYKESGEAGKDEIYFTWGFGGDGEAEVAHRTGEFGSVTTGTQRSFPREPPVYRGYVENACAGHIICWEADHSSSEWYDKLIQVMREVANHSSYLSLSVGDEDLDFLIGLIPGPIGDFANIGFWLENIANLIANFLEIFRNHDDKVMEHSYAYSRDYLLTAVPREFYVGYEFNGGGGGHFLFSATFKTAAELLG